MSNITIVNFPKNEEVKTVYTGLWQWDYGQILRIQGLDLPSAVEIHFSLQEKGGEAVRRIGITSSGVTDVVIPDFILEGNNSTRNYEAYAFIYLSDEEAGETTHEIVMKIKARSKPEGSSPSDETSFGAIMKAVQKIAEQSGGGVSDEKIQEAVENYLTENPIETDETLTKSGEAADAKMVGDKFNQISEQIGDIQASEVTGISAELTAEFRTFFTNFKTLLPQLAYVETSNVGNTLIMNASNIVTVLGGGTVEPDKPIDPEATLTSISATYTGGNVTVGTALTDLTGITVTAHYSDGSTSNVADYTLSGTIAEGENTITVSCGGKTTTFTVTGVAEEVIHYSITRNLTNYTSSSDVTTVVKGEAHNETLTVANGYESSNVTITMGGVDITSDVFGDGYILITEVTGDIVITAIAIEPQYIDTVNVEATSAVQYYSDEGVTSLGNKYYGKIVQSTIPTETNSNVKVRISNETDADITIGTLYCGAMKNQWDIVTNKSYKSVYNTISKNYTSALATGKSIEFEYTVPAGYFLAVQYIEGLTYEVIGVMNYTEPIMQYAVSNIRSGNITSYYSDNGETLLTYKGYDTRHYIDTTFDTDKILKVTIVNTGTGKLDFVERCLGCMTSGTETDSNGSVYYAQLNTGQIPVGLRATLEFTVKAGYVFMLSSDTLSDAYAFDMYVEDAE